MELEDITFRTTTTSRLVGVALQAILLQYATVICSEEHLLVYYFNLGVALQDWNPGVVYRGDLQ